MPESVSGRPSSLQLLGWNLRTLCRAGLVMPHAFYWSHRSVVIGCYQYYDEEVPRTD